MEHESEYLRHLLGAYIRQEEPRGGADIDWVKLVELSQIHCVTGIVGYMTMMYPICPDPQLKEGLRKNCMGSIAVYSRRGVLAESFSQLLEENEIDHIVMKGFVLRQYYPVPELRSFGDIDLVIRPEDRQKCHELMLSQGFRIETDWEPVYSYTRDSEFYEMHTQIMEVEVSNKANYRAYFDQMWQYTRPTGQHTCEFTPEFHFLYILTHIAKHVVGSGAGIRMYLDVAAFIRHFADALDWAWVERELEKLCFTDFANMVLTLVEKCFGIASPIPLKEVEPAILEDFLDFTMTGGVFGKVGRDSGVDSLKKESRETDSVSKVGTFVRRLFPKAKTIESRYTYLQDKPWLLPVAWVHRLVKTRDAWKQHAEEAQNIMSADLSEVQRIKRMYEEIGL